MKSILGWLAGKKTYLVSAFVILIALGLVYLGRLTPETAMAVLLVALGLFAASFRSALARNQALVLGVLTDAAVLGKAVAAKNSKAIGAAGVSLVGDCSTLAEQIQKDGNA